MRTKHIGLMLAAALTVVLSLAALIRLLEPKYMGQVTEGAFIGEYYFPDNSVEGLWNHLLDPRKRPAADPPVLLPAGGYPPA